MTRSAEIIQFWLDPKCRKPRTFLSKNVAVSLEEKFIFQKMNIAPFKFLFYFFVCCLCCCANIWYTSGKKKILNDFFMLSWHLWKKNHSSNTKEKNTSSWYLNLRNPKSKGTYQWKWSRRYAVINQLCCTWIVFSPGV